MQNIQSVTETITNTYPEFTINTMSWYSKIDSDKDKFTNTVRIAALDIPNTFMNDNNTVSRPMKFEGLTLSNVLLTLVETGKGRLPGKNRIWK